MSPPEELDLSSLSRFKATDLLAEGTDRLAPAAPRQVALDAIDLDPCQPRRGMRTEGIAELAESIRRHGVLEPVSLRSHPAHVGRYIVNRGERRVRAARQAGLLSVPGFIDERVDPFAQAVENLHREDMSPFDLSTFIAEREREGHTRAEIARRLGKPRSFITEAASLNDAPTELRQAVEEGRIAGDVRTLYRLVTTVRDRPQAVQELLAQGHTINRSKLDETMERTDPSRAASPARTHRAAPVASGGRTVLVVDHKGQRGSLRLKACGSDVGEVCFADGSRVLLPLAELRPVCWATEG
ncbi:ParB/RepB/Spo0J family partition protein [Variovorax atrisoli]|uniref:ParB/RepB/Spo0J family partition protein n=1 Tax=Variovorax atrisoli TaxID=3394203 RepID=UPI003391D1A4